MSLRVGQTGPRVGSQASRVQPWSLGVVRPSLADSSRTLGSGYYSPKGSGRGLGVLGKAGCTQGMLGPLGGWVGGAKLAWRPQLKLAASLRGSEHACQPPRSPLPWQAICRHVFLLSPPGPPSSSHPQGLEGLCTERVAEETCGLCCSLAV